MDNYWSMRIRWLTDKAATLLRQASGGKNDESRRSCAVLPAASGQAGKALYSFQSGPTTSAPMRMRGLIDVTQLFHVAVGDSNDAPVSTLGAGFIIV